MTSAPWGARTARSTGAAALGPTRVGDVRRCGARLRVGAEGAAARQRGGASLRAGSRPAFQRT
ncbi:MAG: hypothetical protein JOY70_05270 [Acidisphaera sp.]|nr:hypothetical protein [Acidisphaera sp.]MBV9813747.1 hypothetical protein [Acetobacteraceae bacterium]